MGGGASNRCRCSLVCSLLLQQFWAISHHTRHKTWQYLFKYGALHLRNTSLMYASGVCSHICYVAGSCAYIACVLASLCIFTYLLHGWNQLSRCPTLVSDASQLFIMCRSASSDLIVSHHGNRLVSPTGGVSFSVSKPDIHVLCIGRCWQDITK